MIKKILKLLIKSRTSKTVSASTFFVDALENDRNKVIVKAVNESTASQREILKKHDKQFANAS